MTQGKARKALPTPWEFGLRESGTYMSELVPHMGSIADDLCLVRRVFEAINHALAITFYLRDPKCPVVLKGAWLFMVWEAGTVICQRFVP